MEKSYRQLCTERQAQKIKILNMENGTRRKSRLDEILATFDAAISDRIFKVIARAMKKLDHKVELCRVLGTPAEYEAAKKEARHYFRHVVTPACERKYGKEF